MLSQSAEYLFKFNSNSIFFLITGKFQATNSICQLRVNFQFSVVLVDSSPRDLDLNSSNCPKENIWAVLGELRLETILPNSRPLAPHGNAANLEDKTK